MNYLRNLLSKNSKAGVTPVEVTFSTVIGSVVLGMIMLQYVIGINGLKLGLALAEINSDSRLAMDRMVRDVRSAIELEPSRVIDGTSYTTGDDELILRVYSIDSAGDAIPGTFDYVVYAFDAVDTTQLRKIIDPDAASSRNSFNQIIAENVNSYLLRSSGVLLSGVSLSSVTAVEIALSVNKTPIANKSVSQVINSEVELRND